MIAATSEVGISYERQVAAGCSKRQSVDVDVDLYREMRNAMLWLFAPDGALGERSPAEVFPIDPGRVIALCQHRLSTARASEQSTAPHT